MQEELEHKISPKTALKVEQHLVQSTEHVRQLEQHGQAIAGGSELGLQAGQAIKKHAQAIEEHLAVAKQLAMELQQTKSTEVYTQIQSQHIEAVQEHIKANKEFLKMSQPEGTS